MPEKAPEITPTDITVCSVLTAFAAVTSLAIPTGPAQTLDVSMQRAFILADAAVRVFAPIHLIDLGVQTRADNLMRQPPIVDAATARFVQSIFDNQVAISWCEVYARDAVVHAASAESAKTDSAVRESVTKSAIESGRLIMWLCLKMPDRCPEIMALAATSLRRAYEVKA